jgi:cyclic-di-GMP-binding protein
MPTTDTHPPTEAASLFFSDARACKAWLGSLAVTNISQTQSTKLDALRVFNRAEFDPLERLKCLELLRDRVAFMLGELRARHFARTMPLAPADASAWSSARGVLEEMEAGYRRCLAEHSLEAHAALISQRIVRYLGAQMLLHAWVYRRFDASLWSRLHGEYAAAESAGLAREKVKDSLDAEGAASSVDEAYARVILVQAAGLHEMTPAQVAFAEALLRQWMRKVSVLDHPPAEAASAILPLVVDLSAARGAEAIPRDALAYTQRVIDAEGLVRSIRRRVRALQGGEELASLGLPPEAAGVDPLHSLQRLMRRWSEPAPREAAMKPPASPKAGLALGLADIHFFLSGGKSFEQPDQERELSRQEKEDIAVFGRVTQRTQSMTVLSQGVTLDNWAVIAESLDTLRLRRAPSSTKSVAVGRIVGLRLGDAAPLQVGVIRALQDEAEGLSMTVALYPGRPSPVAVRGAKPPWIQAVLLPGIEKMRVPASLAVPSAMLFRGRPAFVWQDRAVEGRVNDVLERGADFDRVTLLL